jgi:hypothetical protein
MENPQNWNSEQKRLERKRRLEKLKSKEGVKAPIKKSGRFAKIFFPILAVCLVLAIGIWAAIQFAVPQMMFPAMTIGGKNVSSVEFSFYYVSTLNQLQIDRSTAEGKEKLASASTVEGHTDKTWQEYAVFLTAETVVEFQIQHELAVAAGLTLTETEKTEIQKIFDDLITQTGSTKEADRYLVDFFGKNVTIRNLIPVFEKSTLANRYALLQIEDIEISEEEIQDFFNENRSDYEKVTFRMLAFEADTNPNATTEEIVAAQAASLEAAETFLENVKNEQDFIRLANEKIETDTQAMEDATYEAMTDEEKAEYDEEKEAKQANSDAVLAGMTAEEKASYERGKVNTDRTLIRSLNKSEIESSNPDLAAWLVDSDRAQGDTEIYTLSETYYAFMFISKDDAFDLTAARHILISPNKDKNIQSGEYFTPEEWDAARTKARDILAEITSLEKFKELVTEHSEDTGSKTNGGLYEDIKRGDMVPQFDEWVFDSTRKAEDLGIVRTDYGYHIIRFENRRSTTIYQENKDLIEGILREKAYVDRLEEMKKEDRYQYDISSFGLRLINW